MPIGDLLAEISGERPSPVAKTPPPSGIKRKADDLNGDSTKVAKARHTDVSTSKITRDVQGSVIGLSRSDSRPAAKAAYTGTSARRRSPQPHQTNSPSTNGRSSKLTATNGHHTSRSIVNGRPAPSSASSSAQRKPASDVASRPKLNPPSLPAPKMPPPKPSPTTPTASDPGKAPKKGSFAEIMARGAKAQQVMGKVGVIQHKAIEKPVAKKDREPAKPGVKTPTGKPYLGNARPTTMPSRDATHPAGQTANAQRNGVAKDGKQAGKQRPGSSGGDVQEKKLKKSATATTGYTGTARPKPGASSSKSSSARNGKPQASSRAGGLLGPPKSSRRSREDDYEDDLDDFIEYDDEDEPDPRGLGYSYGYDSDASSDMEAGISDIDEEEARATKEAIKEDKREQELEEKLRRQKEERKKRLNQGQR
ncbi:hypothetical protein DL768_006470 [Monosporascus sp. mg162]|nr:hypothetical protein DL768_006470 [Monosporascus sp. mg162]